MKRPIPEGVVVPHPNAIILGWGKAFNVPEEGFEGYAVWPGKYPDWNEGHKQGDDDRLIYAADRDSEVARLNRLAKFESDLEAVIAADPQAAKEEFQAILDRRKERDKDALIRELVRVAERANRIIYPMGDRDYELPSGYHLDGYLDAQQASTEISDILTLARKTCPEAFDGCYETPADGR